MTRRPVRGQPLSIAADDYAGLLEMLRWFQSRGRSTPLTLAKPSPIVIRGFNKTGGDLAIGDPVKFGKAVVSDAVADLTVSKQIAPAFEFESIDQAAIDDRNIALVVAPAKDDKRTQVIVDGVMVVNLALNDPADTRVAVETDGTLSSGSSGMFRIVWSANGVTAIAFDTLAGVSSLTIQAPATGIPAATNYVFGSAVCDLMERDPADGKWKTTGQTETIYNPQTSVALTEGLRLGWAIWDNSSYVLNSKLCGDNRSFSPTDPINPPGA